MNTGLLIWVDLGRKVIGEALIKKSRSRHPLFLPRLAVAA